MAVPHKLLAQSKIAAANVQQQVYRPSGAGVVGADISKITVCNGEATAQTFRLTIDPEDRASVDDTIGNADRWDAAIPANDTYTIWSVGLQAGAALNVKASSVNMCVNVFGREITS